MRQPSFKLQESRRRDYKSAVEVELGERLVPSTGANKKLFGRYHQLVTRAPLLLVDGRHRHAVSFDKLCPAAESLDCPRSVGPLQGRPGISMGGGLSGTSVGLLPGLVILWKTFKTVRVKYIPGQKVPHVIASVCMPCEIGRRQQESKAGQPVELSRLAQRDD
jgi:hypothetical protein